MTTKGNQEDMLLCNSTVSRDPGAGQSSLLNISFLRSLHCAPNLPMLAVHSSRHPTIVACWNGLPSPHRRSSSRLGSPQSHWRPGERASTAYRAVVRYAQSPTRRRTRRRRRRKIRTRCRWSWRAWRGGGREGQVFTASILASAPTRCIRRWTTTTRTWAWIWRTSATPCRSGYGPAWPRSTEGRERDGSD